MPMYKLLLIECLRLDVHLYIIGYHWHFIHKHKCMFNLDATLKMSFFLCPFFLALFPVDIFPVPFFPVDIFPVDIFPVPFFPVDFFPVDFFPVPFFLCPFYRAPIWIAQLVERSYIKRETMGSTPGSGLYFSAIHLHLIAILKTLSISMQHTSTVN